MRLVHGSLLLLVASVAAACSGAGRDGVADATADALASLDGAPADTLASLDASDAPPLPDGSPYARSCEPAEGCPAPYECTLVPDDGMYHCLQPCAAPGDCPGGCVCKGVDGAASWGPEGYCICV